MPWRRGARRHPAILAGLIGQGDEAPSPVEQGASPQAWGLHLTIYSASTLGVLRRRPEPAVREVLVLADLLIDGRYVVALAKGTGE